MSIGFGVKEPTREVITCRQTWQNEVITQNPEVLGFLSFLFQPEGFFNIFHIFIFGGALRWIRFIFLWGGTRLSTRKSSMPRLIFLLRVARVAGAHCPLRCALVAVENAPYSENVSRPIIHGLCCFKLKMFF